MKSKHLALLFLAATAFAQTTVPGPLTVTSPVNPTVQSGIIWVDIGQPSATPAAKQYILSIVNGTIQESDNGGPYHTLVGATGPQGPPGPQGPGIGVGNTLTLTITCPKGKGTIQAGWVTQNCKATITAIQ